MSKLIKGSLLLISLSISIGCAPRQIILTRSRLMMGHVPVNISIRTSPPLESKALQASEEAYQLAQQLENQISEYQPSSEISCLNQNAGVRSCPISETTRELLQRSLEIAEQTDSAFDIRFGSLTKEGIQGGILFQQNAQEAFLPNPKTRLGVGAIGKGFIVDKMIDFLKSKGFENVLISGGGDLRANGGAWEVAIQKPGGLPGEFEEKRKIYNQAIATSGTYEQGNHIIDPRTGQKVSRTGSVSVEAENLTLADALATAFFVMGKKESEKHLNKIPKIKVIWTEP